MRFTALIVASLAAAVLSQDVVYDYVIAGAGTAGLVSLNKPEIHRTRIDLNSCWRQCCLRIRTSL